MYTAPAMSSVPVGILARVLSLASAHFFLPLLRISGSLDQKRRDKALYYPPRRNSDASWVRTTLSGKYYGLVVHIDLTCNGSIPLRNRALSSIILTFQINLMSQ